MQLIVFKFFFTDWGTRVHVTVHAVLTVRHDSPLHILPVPSQVRLFPPRIYNCTNRPWTYESEYDSSLYVSFRVYSSLYVCCRVRFFPVRLLSCTILPCTFVVEYDSSLYVCCHVRFFPVRLLSCTILPCTFVVEYDTFLHVSFQVRFIPARLIY